jgi:hypothetical protein
MADRTNAEDVLRAAGTTEDLDGLLDAIESAGKKEAFDLIAGTDPIPSNMSDLRALRLRRICETLKRELTTREIQIVFRIGESAARAVDARMRATYPRQMADIRAARMKAMQKAIVKVTAEQVEGEDVYKIRSPQRGAIEFARELLIDAGWESAVQWPGEGEYLLLAYRVVLPDGKKKNLLTDVLGIPLTKVK